MCCRAQLIREKYWEYEYEEVVTPNLYNFELWERSGHADHYKDNMFLVDIEEQQFGLKPMNCPGAALLTSLKASKPIRLWSRGWYMLSGLVRVSH
jgi:threonyl-tRNA synthetase